MPVIFKRKSKLSIYYTKICINATSIIIENVHSEIVSYSKNNCTINKMSYSEITNDKTYLISEVIWGKENNSIFTKEEMYYNDRRDILNNEIINCIGALCKKNK